MFTVGKHLFLRNWFLWTNCLHSRFSKLFRKLNRSGVPYDIIRKYGDKWDSKGLEWLRSKSILNLTGSELRKLEKLGDNLYNYTEDDGVVLPDMQVIKSPSFVDEFGSAKWQKGDGFIIGEYRIAG